MGFVEIWRNLTTAEINGITRSILSVCVDALVFIANGQPIPKMREIPYFSAFLIQRARPEHAETRQLSAKGLPTGQMFSTIGMQSRSAPYRDKVSFRNKRRITAQTATVKVSSLRVTARYMVSRSKGFRPASVINRTRSARRIPCGVVAPASW
jgi:hypothetical protein